MPGISSIKNYFHEINPESVIFNEETNQYYAPVNLEQFNQINLEPITNDDLINEYDETEPEVSHMENKDFVTFYFLSLRATFLNLSLLRFQANVCNKLPMKTKDIEDLEDPKKIKDCDTKKLQAIALYSSTTKCTKLFWLELNADSNKCKTQVFENLITDVHGNRCAEEK
ncbi:hypothetical protein RN001_002300 [Aquatica leii]|uniref:Uncharacterized protein n=1 Tax=Aquatica leii TaxID=1421715 RepID=A0AAN7PGU1_9COLE|nr:hypothetical protein RN001_002300 [Aquatica leii]